MALNWTYTTEYENLNWTKRFVRYTRTGIRSMLKRVRKDHRPIKRRNNLCMLEHLINCKRDRFMVYQLQRRNYNTVYRRMQIPV